MTPERKQEIERIYQAALRQESARRAEFVNQECARDEDLRRAVESRLQAIASEPGETEAFSTVLGAHTVTGPRRKARKAQPSRMALTQLGKYELRSEIGRGGFGTVYVAWDPVVNREVAIKVLTAGDDPDVLMRFRNEASSAGKLRHRNIVTIHDFGEENGLPFIVMELLDGVDLQDVMARKMALPLYRKVEILSQAAAGLHHAHMNGLVHRDVKPGNIMVLNDFSVKLLDFGIARLTRATNARLTRKGNLVGTVSYMAPEQLKGEDSDGLSDVFSLGVVAYELLAGRHPFHADDPVAVMFAITAREPQPLRALAPECPAALEEIVMRALTKNRDQRYQVAEDIVLDCEPILRELRHEHAAELIRKAQQTLDSGHLDAASGLVREIIELDPGNQSARRLRDAVQQQLQRRAVKPKIDALLAESRNLAAARQFDSALERIESALRLDRTDPELQSLREQVRTAQGHAKRAELLLADAQKALEEKNLTGAYQNVSAALQTDRDNRDAAALLEKIRGEIDQREKERALRDGLTKARSSLMVEAFDEALTLLTALEAQHPGSGELRDLNAEVLRRKAESQRRDHLVRNLAAARDLLRQRQLRQAIANLEALSAEFPNTAEVADLLAFARQAEQAELRAQKIARAEQQIEQYLAAQDFKGALRTLDETFTDQPADATMSRLHQRVISAKAAADREQAIREIAARGEDLLRNGKPDSKHQEAMQLLDQALREHGNEAALVELRRRAEFEWEEQKREKARTAAVAAARELIKKQRPAEAIWSIQQALTAHPGDSELTGLLEEAQTLLASQQRREAVSRMVQEISARLASGQLDLAEASVKEGLHRFPQEPGLEALQARVQEERRVAVRRLAIQNAKESAGRLLQQSKFEEALRQVETALAGGRDDGLARLKLDIENQWSREKLRATLARARQLLEGAKFDEAIALLTAASGASPEAASEAAGLLSYARERQRAAAIRAEIERTLVDSARLADTGRLDEALNAVETGVGKFSGDSALLRLRDNIQERIRALAEIKRREEERQRQEAERIQREDAEQKRREDEERRIREEAERERLEEVARKKREEEEARVRAEAERKLRAEAERKQREEAEQKRREDEERRVREEAERKRREEAERQRLEEEARKKREEEAAQARAEAERKQREEAERKRLEDEARRAHEEAERQRLEQEARKKREEEEARVRAEAERKQREEAERKRLEDEARCAHEEAQRQRAADENKLIEETQARVAELRQKRAYAEALTLVSAAIQKIGPKPALEGLRDVLLEDQKRAAEAQKALQAARDALRQGHPERALEIAGKVDAADASEEAIRAIRDAAQGAIAERNRAAAVQAVVTQAEQQCARKEFSQSQQTIEAGLTAFPGNQALLALRKSTQRQYEEQQREIARAEALRTLERLRSGAARAQATGEIEQLALQAAEIAAGYPADKEIKRTAKAAQQAIARRRKELQPSAMALSEAPTSEGPTVPAPKISRAIAAGIAGVVLISGVALWKGMGARGTSLEISSTPDGANIQVGDRTCTTPHCILNLPAGRYQVQATKSGYRAANAAIEIKSGAVPPLQMTLAPLPARLLIGTNFSSGTVRLDNRTAGTLRNGELTFDAVEAGEHTVEVRSPDGRASLKFAVVSAQPPKLQAAPSVTDSQALVVSGYAAATDIRCDCQNGEVSVDGKSTGVLKNGQLTIGALAPGTHDFRVTAADGMRQAVVALGDEPALSLFLAADRNMGTLIIEAGADDVRVFVNNQLQSSRTRQGLLRLPLPVKLYSVRVEKSGFRTPQEQRVDLKKGEQARLSFSLKPQDAILSIRDGLAGVKVQIDGQPAGVTGNDGSLQSSVPAGNHTIEFTRDGYAPRRVTRDFAPGATISLGREEALLAEIRTAPPAKPVPDPRAIEAEDWDRIRNATNPDVIDDFLRKHADGAHAEEARAKTAQLRKQQQEERARQAEQTAWDAADKTRKTSLQDFVSRFGSGPHAEEARGLIAGIDNQEAKQQADAIAAARAKEQMDRAAADELAIGGVLKAYEGAYNALNMEALQSIWVGMPKSTTDAINSQFRTARTVTLRLQPNARPTLNGNSATVTCARSLTMVTRAGDRPPAASDRVRISLERTGAAWVIRAMTPY